MSAGLSSISSPTLMVIVVLDLISLLIVGFWHTWKLVRLLSNMLLMIRRVTRTSSGATIVILSPPQRCQALGISSTRHCHRQVHPRIWVHLSQKHRAHKTGENILCFIIINNVSMIQHADEIEPLLLLPLLLMLQPWNGIYLGLDLLYVWPQHIKIFKFLRRLVLCLALRWYFLDHQP